MAEVAEVWKAALPEIRQSVTGVGVWTALNSAVPLAFEGGVVVLGLRYEDNELAGHLKLPQIKRAVEVVIGKRTGQPVQLRVIEGATLADWERAKRRDAEAKRLQEAAEERQRAEIASKHGWESVYEQLGRRFAAVPNKSLPQNRAKFYLESIELVAAARREADRDDLGERNFARCLERLAQYAEMPATVVAIDVLRKAGEV